MEKIDEVVEKVKGSKPILYLGIGVLVFVVLYIGWLVFFRAPSAPVGVSVVGAKSNEVKNVGTEKISAPVIVYKKSKETKEALNLPTEIVNNERIRILDSVRVPASDNSTTTTTILDTETGKSETYLRRDKSPLFAFQDKNYLGAELEVNTKGSVRPGVYYKRDLFRIKDVYVQGKVAAYSESTSKVDVSGTASLSAELRF